jgi:hypothetical protein
MEENWRLTSETIPHLQSENFQTLDNTVLGKLRVVLRPFLPPCHSRPLTAGVRTPAYNTVTSLHTSPYKRNVMVLSHKRILLINKHKGKLSGNSTLKELLISTETHVSTLRSHKQVRVQEYSESHVCIQQYNYICGVDILIFIYS